jgi:lactoylglutathione lyase
MNMLAPLEIGIAVRDLARMTKFYAEVLGCTLVSEVNVPADKSRLNGLSPDGCTVVRLQTPYGERIKLLAAPSTTLSERERWLLARAGLAYLTLIIEGIDAWCARLKAQGVALASERPVENRPGLRVLFFQDPEGNVLELVEYADLASYRPDLKR